MYIVHAQLTGPDEATFADMSAEDVLAFVHPGDGVEHATLHPFAHPSPTLAIWLLADSLHAAEAQARVFALRLLHRHALFSNWTLVRVEVPLLAPLVHDMLGPAGKASPAPNGHELTIIV